MPMFELLGTAPENKEDTVDPGAHSVPRAERTRELPVCLDRDSGPVE